MKFRQLILKWWIWPLPLLILQVIQLFLVRRTLHTSAGISDDVLKIVNFQDAITKTSIILILANVGLWVYYIIKKEGKAILGHLVMMSGVLVLCFWNIIGIGVWWMFNSDLVDNFGKEHPIPENVEYYEPLPSFQSEKVDEFGNTFKTDISDLINPDDSSTWLQVSQGFQGGMYRYSFYIPQEFDDGEIWLECYEVTDNVQLSKKRITDSTVQKITPEDKGKITEPREFSIYEGVWGDFYLARFEVWYIDYATRTKRKLTEKIYKVEGWMR